MACPRADIDAIVIRRTEQCSMQSFKDDATIWACKDNNAFRTAALEITLLIREQHRTRQSNRNTVIKFRDYCRHATDLSHQCHLLEAFFFFFFLVRTRVHINKGEILWPQAETAVGFLFLKHFLQDAAPVLAIFSWLFFPCIKYASFYLAFKILYYLALLILCSKTSL